LLIAIAIIGFTYAGGTWANFGSHYSGAVGGFTGFMLALVATLWAYDGWNDLNQVGGEVRDPERSIPVALIGGVAIVAGLYMLMNAAVQYVLPAPEIAASKSPAAAMAQVVLGASGAALITAGIALSMVVTLNGTVMAYLPMGGTITVDLTQISGTLAQGWWYNPQDGSITNLGGFATSGSQDFTAPDDNDWVLVLDDASRNLPPPGLISPHLGIAVVGQNTFEISFSSNPGLSFSVQSNSGSSNAPWQTIGTVTTDDSGGAVYDVTTTSAAGLYRVTYP